MKRVFFIFSMVVALLLVGLPADAETTDIMDGQIGKYKIVMELDFKDNGKVTGWYYYKSKGPSHKISLSGSYRDSGVNSGYNYNVDLTETVNGKITGYFKGKYLCGYASDIQTFIYLMDGTWSSPKGNKLEFGVGNY